MELQLGLALPTLLIPMTTKGSLLDLNNCSSFSGDVSTEGSGSSASIHTNLYQSFGNYGSSCVIINNKKRSLEEALEADSSSTDTLPRTLPLLLWNKQPKDEDDQSNGAKTCNLTLIKNDDETEGIVGWPPIKSYRKKHCGQDQAAAENVGRCGGGGGGGSNCSYVKVQIEGVLITRKIDLSLHQSYDTLISNLLFMFGRGHESVDGYTLTYQDQEGDWLLAADVPWRAFIESVQRLKLIRNAD